MEGWDIAHPRKNPLNFSAKLNAGVDTGTLKKFVNILRDGMFSMLL